MRKATVKILLNLIILLVSYQTSAQVPQGFNYQAVARNAVGTLIQNQALGIKLTIHKDSANGIITYSERQTPTTNQFGLFTVTLGKGTALTGIFDTIKWSTGNFWLQAELDVNGGTAYTDMGTSQLLSVPFAMYAASGNAGPPGPPGAGAFTHYIGELYGGGVVFHVYRDAANVEHGLIVALNDQSVSQFWSNLFTNLIGPAAQSTWNGLSNSNAIVGQASHTSSAAKLCLDLVSGGQNDWYLPSIDELNLLYNSKFNVNKTLSTAGTQIGLNNYWSSTEMINTSAWLFSFDYGFPGDFDKNNLFYVRAIRAY